MSFADATRTGSAETSVPAPRERSAAVQDAVAGLAEVDRATRVLYQRVAELDLAALRGPSLLPGWSRGHLVTHLARNADALVNLLTWAKTGVEHPMYPSPADRDADIAEGAARLPQLLRADLDAACERFATAARELPPTAWEAEVAHPVNGPFLAHRVPWLRLREVWFHLVDLAVGVGFEDLPEHLLEGFVDGAVGQYADRADVPDVRLEVTLPDGRQRSWELTAATGSTLVSGSAAAVLGWLTGRQGGAALNGSAPALPRWL
ncbi:maleylpyruvate isomerase family mycothiol-dependent enzyme [Actinosynnema sp. NPDC047251]|uniref:Mycothiol-dependent maleylpyruvate isomerase n=1 Tax=Saccharothrix espanaensis (strain ATCC 51144 / DSM 44229 / JCM 9112 / NBRC 15066 / NRRL 15764) TaxID=1179773 RepID=K0K6B8_SACES|nr:maleylpyruvate isomerase family mycothiol-dependent enzyme [Saccharothrix espanaensis]CCH33866.1 Mycothiol-dependent maleylpyruvate isomerase [Saccharothrix espanaensis DSM 44229]